MREPICIRIICFYITHYITGCLAKHAQFQGATFIWSIASSLFGPDLKFRLHNGIQEDKYFEQKQIQKHDFQLSSVIKTNG